jgi:hypothetical protein
MKAPGRGRRSDGATSSLRFEYFLETPGQPVLPKHPLWRQLLPTSRRTFYAPGSPCAAPEASIPVGDYFLAVQAFIEGAGWEALVRILAGRGAHPSAAQVFRIFLAKHGEYYHPARVETEIEGVPYRWVVNVAVSAVGKSFLFKEYALLERLAREFTAAYVPRVYATAEVGAGCGRSLPMFLGQWFPDFHEFHATRDTPGGGQALALWDPDRGPILLDAAQAHAVYRQIARILTYYLSLTAFESIGAWHHAAGDFVVRLEDHQAEVRLITVRDYRPLFRSRPESGARVRAVTGLLEALLIFLLNVSVRTRLDRLDGTGDLAWSDPLAVEATVAGVLDGLADKTAPWELPLPIDALFRRFLATCSSEDLLLLCTDLVKKNYPAGSTERCLVQPHVKEHAAALAEAFARL